MRDDARDLLAEGKDPSLEKQREKLRAGALAENTFTTIANEYCRKRRRDGDRAWAPATAARCEYLLSLLDNSIGKMPIHEIEPIDALAAVRKIEKRSAAIGAANPEEHAMIQHGLPCMMAVNVAPRPTRIGVSTPPAQSELGSLPAGSAALRAQWPSDFYVVPPITGWPVGLLQSLQSTPKPFYP